MSDHTEDFERAASIAALVSKLGQVRRATEHADGERESVTTHTLMLALVALDLAHIEDRCMCLEDVLIFALVHDLPEALVGDVSTLIPLSEEEADEKAAREDWATRQIDEHVSKDIAWYIRAYEMQDTLEARFVRTLDKVLPKLMHVATGCRVVKRRGVSKGLLRSLHRDQGKGLRRLDAEAWGTLTLVHDFFDWASDRSEEAYDYPDPLDIGADDE